MTIQKNQVSRHIMNDRADRLAAIGASVGFGQAVLCERYSEEKGGWRCIMDSGAMLIWNTDKTKLITGFIPSLSQAAWVFRGQMSNKDRKLIQVAQVKYEKEMRKLQKTCVAA